MIHYLAQSDSKLLTELLRIVGGGSIATLLSLGVWALITGKVIPRWMWDDKCKLLDAERAAKETERLARIAAEARLDQSIAALNALRASCEEMQQTQEVLVETLQKKGNRTTRDESRQEGTRP